MLSSALLATWIVFSLFSFGKAFTIGFAPKLDNLHADDDPELEAKIEELQR